MDGYNCQYFLKWIIGEGLLYWDELRYEHVTKYYKSLLDRDLAYDTIRLYLMPICRVSRWVAANWPAEYVDICSCLHLSRRDSFSGNYDSLQSNPVLLVHEVLDYLHWLATHPRWEKLLVGVALQGLAGLQLLEALRLTWAKVDFSKSEITIEGEVKNRFRIRRIPVVGVVAWLLRRTYHGQAQPPDPGDRVVSVYTEHSAYARAVRDSLRLCNAEAEIKPKDLRNTIQTAAIDGGWYGYYVQRYVGHAPSTVGERH